MAMVEEIKMMTASRVGPAIPGLRRSEHDAGGMNRRRHHIDPVTDQSDSESCGLFAML